MADTAAFGKFLSIHTVDRAEEVVAAALSALEPDLAATPFLLTEKVHGACATVVLSDDGRSVRALRSRNRHLEADSSFYGFQELAAKMFPPDVVARIHRQTVAAQGALLRLLKAREDARHAASGVGAVEEEANAGAGVGAGAATDDGGEGDGGGGEGDGGGSAATRHYTAVDVDAVLPVCVFGEVYGGMYPHPEVPVPPGVGHVQKGVYYRPDVGFLGFHVKAGDRYLPQAVALRILEGAGVPVVPILFEGSFAEALKRSRAILADDTANHTLIPAWLGLPELPANRREGHVIAPARVLLPLSGRRKGKIGAHYFVKHVHPKFRESLNDLPVTRKVKTWKDSLVVPGVPVDAPGAAAAWDELTRHITLLRAEKTVGKTGMERDLVGAMTKTMTAEVLEEAAAALGGADLGVDADVRAKLTKAARRRCGELISGIVLA